MAEQVAGSDTTLPPLARRLSGASNVLVLAPSFGSGSDSVCMHLLAGEDAAETSVLGITYTRSPTEWLGDWKRHVGETPARGAVIGVGDVEIGSTDFPPEMADAWTVTVVDNASDLTGLGIKLSEFLTEAYDADDSTRIRLCFDSLTALLQYADLKRAFRFLHVVTGRVKSANAVGHYHLDPAAYDQQTLATLKGLFDAVVEVDEDGEWSVKTR